MSIESKINYLIRKIKCIKIGWGNIIGDITKQTDLIEYINNLPFNTRIEKSEMFSSFSVPANSQISVGTISVIGATIGDLVVINQTGSALIYKAEVSASDTVSIYACNITTSNISFVNTTLKITVFK